MAANRKQAEQRDHASAQGKLSRLLDTETELDAMLRETKREASELVQAARAEAEDRIRRFEAELSAADTALRERIGVERDEAVAAIRAEAKRAVEQLEALDERHISELAQHVVGRVAGDDSESPP